MTMCPGNKRKTFTYVFPLGVLKNQIVFKYLRKLSNSKSYVRAISCQAIFAKELLKKKPEYKNSVLETCTFISPGFA